MQLIRMFFFGVMVGCLLVASSPAQTAVPTSSMCRASEPETEWNTGEIFYDMGVDLYCLWYPSMGGPEDGNCIINQKGSVTYRNMESGECRQACVDAYFRSGRSVKMKFC